VTATDTNSEQVPRLTIMLPDSKISTMNLHAVSSRELVLYTLNVWAMARVPLSIHLTTTSQPHRFQT
jgi:hypothetical protein